MLHTATLDTLALLAPMGDHTDDAAILAAWESGAMVWDATDTLAWH